MASKVRTEKEFAEAIKRGEDTIEVEGNLADKTIRIRATGNVAWAVAIGAVGIAFYSAVKMRPSATGTNLDVKHAFFPVIAGAGAVSVLGVEVASSAIALAVAAGGVGVLKTIRGYRQISVEKGRLVLSDARGKAPRASRIRPEANVWKELMARSRNGVSDMAEALGLEHLQPDRQSGLGRNSDRASVGSLGLEHLQSERQSDVRENDGENMARAFGLEHVRPTTRP